MSDETKMADPSELSPRAAIALMSLQLRSTVQEAADAEAEADAIDSDAALWQLRSRLTPLIEDRRRALEEEVAAERERAAAEIAAAHAEADRIVAAAIEEAAAGRAAEEAAARAAEEAAARAAEEQAAVAAAEALALAEAENGGAEEVDDAVATVEDVATAAPPETEPAAATLPPPALTVIPLDVPSGDETPLFDDPMIEWAPEASELSPPELPSNPATLPIPSIDSQMAPPSLPAVADGERAPLHVVIDAESFARAFAAAIAPALENRQAPNQPPQGWMPVQAPAPKKSFWAHAWHPDVLLSGLAMVIVVIVLIAWTG